LIVRYRKITDANDFSRDAAVVAEFIGDKEYRSSFVRLGECLNFKGFVTPFDDALFALELQLLNLERMRVHYHGKFPMLPAQLHAAANFLIGLGQTIPALSNAGKARLLGCGEGETARPFEEGFSGGTLAT
jgi:hypothetical protein